MIILQNSTRRILREVAESTGLSFNQVLDIWASQFKYTATEMAKGEKGFPDTFKNVMIRYLGTFVSSPHKILHMTKVVEEKKNAEHN